MANNQERIAIKTQKQLRAAKNDISRKQSTNIVKLVFNRSGLHFELTQAISNSLELDKKPGFVLDGITELTVENFTDTIIAAEFRGSGNQQQKQEVTQKANLFYFAAVKIDGRNSDVISLYKRNGEIIGYSHVTKQRGPVSLERLKECGYGLYIGAAYSPSEARKNTTTLYKTDSSKELEKKMDKLTFGTYTILRGKEITLEESQKIAARMGQWKTGMTHMEDSKLVAAFFMGKWNVDGIEHADGKAFARDVKVAKVLSNEKYEIVRNAVEGILIQNRPFAICKTEAKVTNDGYIKNKILYDAGGHGRVIWINREEVTQEQQREFDKKDKGEYAGCVVVVKPKDVPEDLRLVDYYTDLNGLKASFDLRRDSGLNILAIDKPLKGGTVNTNMQQLETFAMANPVATKQILKEIASDFNKSKMYSVLNLKPGVPSIKDMEQMYTAGIVKSIAPSFALQNQKVFGVIADQTTQAMVKAVNGLNYKVPGQSRIMQMDFCADFGVRVIPAGYCYAPGIKERILIFTRNPKQHTGEFLILKNLTRKELFKMIDENEQLSKAQKKVLKREYRLLSESTVVIPAYEQYKDATGGSDVDGDTLTMVSYRKFTKLIKKAIKENKIRPTAIQVETPKVEQERDMKFDLKAIHTAFVKLINNGNLTIGEVTYMNNFLLGLLFDLMNGNSAAALEFFKFAGNNGKGEEEYYACPRKYNADLKMNVIDVSFEILEGMVENIKEMELTMANMIAALDDLNAAFMMLQMETIDAAKKGTEVPVPYKGLLNKFQQASKTRIDVDLGVKVRDDLDEDAAKLYKKTNEGVKYLVEQRSGWVQEGVDKNGEPIMKYIHQDLFHEIRVEIAREVMRIARVLKRKHDSTRYSEDIANHFIAAKDQAGEKLVHDLIELKKMYNTVNAGIREDVTEEPHYKVYMEALANTVRLITASMDDADRAELVEAICVPRTDHGSKYSSFAMSTLKEEYLKMVARNFAEIDIAGEPLMVRKNVEEGDVLSFNFGVAKDGDRLAATRADISGEFVIRKINDRYYATKKIEELIPAVEMNNKIIFRADVSANPHVVKEALLNAEKVELKIVFGEGNLVVADGKTVGKFITVSGMTELNELYDGAVGTISNVMIVEETLNDMVTKKDVLVAVMERDSLITPEEELIEDEDIFGDDIF